MLTWLKLKAAHLFEIIGKACVRIERKLLNMEKPDGR